MRVLKSGLGPKDRSEDDELLKMKVSSKLFIISYSLATSFLQLWDEEMSNPIGLAAGFDKNGEAIDGNPVVFPRQCTCSYHSSRSV